MIITENRFDDAPPYIVYAKYKSLEWFDANAFEDVDGDFWETAEARDTFDKESGTPSFSWNDDELYSNIVRSRIGNVLFLSKDKFESAEWGLEEIYTSETHPELYI